MKNIKYCFVDVVKLLASLMIFAMHGTVLSDYGKLQLLLEIGARWGVPFFFICSSFFLFKKDASLTKEQMFKYTKRIATLYGVWAIINFPQIFYSRIYLNGLFKLSTYIDLIKNIFFSSTFTGSWYLISSIYAAWIIYFLCKRWKTEEVLGITCFTQLLCIFTSAYNVFLPDKAASLLSRDLGLLQNVFGGCFYFAVGKYIAEHKTSIIKRHSLKYYIVGLIVFYLFCYVEMLTIIMIAGHTGSDASFMIIPTAIVLFIICLKAKVELSNHLTFRKISTIIYCGQGNILIAKSVVSKLFGVKSSILSFVCAMLMMMFLIILILWLQSRTDNKWVRSLT